MNKTLNLSLKSIVFFSVVSLLWLHSLATPSSPAKITEKMTFKKCVVKPTLDTIVIVTGDTTITLDTIHPNMINEFPIKVKFKLNYPITHNIKIKILIEPLQTLKYLNLYKDDMDTSVTITAADWATKYKDSTITKIISLALEQPHLVIGEQNILLHFQNRKSLFLVRFMPYAGKIKTGALKLVSSGNATIISSRKAGITHDYNSSLNAIDTITIKVRLHGNYDPDHNQLYFMFLDTTKAKHFQILENPVTIFQQEWNTATKKHLTTIDSVIAIPLHIKTVNMNDSLNNIQNLDIILQGQTQALRGTQRVKVSIKDVPFWAEGGTNFDLLDKIKTNNFYAGVYMFDKDIAKILGHPGANNLSFTGGVYESQSVSTSSTSSGGIAYRDLNHIYRDTGAVGANTSVKSIGLLFSPHLKLTNGKTDANGLHVFLSYYAELLWQTVNSRFSYTSKTKDSIVTKEELPHDMNILDYPYKEANISYDFRSQYYGFGLPIYIKENEFNLYINSVWGIANQRFYVYNNDLNKPEVIDPLTINYINTLTFFSPKSNWNVFYLLQYRLNDVAYGVTFSGEIRGLILQNAKPVVTLALSKKFDLSKLFNSIFSATK